MLQKEEYEPEVNPSIPQSTWTKLVRTGPNIQGSQSKLRSQVSCRKSPGTQAEQRAKLDTTTATASAKEETNTPGRA